MYIHTYIYIYVYVYLYIYIQPYTYMKICIFSYLYRSVCIYTYSPASQRLPHPPKQVGNACLWQRGVCRFCKPRGFRRIERFKNFKASTQMSPPLCHRSGFHSFQSGLWPQSSRLAKGWEFKGCGSSTSNEVGLILSFCHPQAIGHACLLMCALPRRLSGFHTSLQFVINHPQPFIVFRPCLGSPPPAPPAIVIWLCNP